MGEQLNEGVEAYNHIVADFWAKEAEKRLDYADAFSREGLKYLFLTNGFSIVSLITFIGNDKIHFDRRGIFWAFFWFLFGLCCTVFSFLCAYFCQNYFMKHSVVQMSLIRASAMKVVIDQRSSNYIDVGNKWITAAIVSAIMALIFFVIGAFVALVAIT